MTSPPPLTRMLGDELELSSSGPTPPSPLGSHPTPIRRDAGLCSAATGVNHR